MLLALLLSAASAGVTLYDEGGQLGTVTSINCSGTGITCTRSGSYGIVTVSSSGLGGGAPTDATYLTQTCNDSLSNEQCMGALASGIVINATTTGVQSIYAGSACTNQFVRGLGRTGAADCQSVSLTADVSGTLPQGSGGTGAGALACSAGQALTSNGSAYSCTSTITASSFSGTVGNSQISDVATTKLTGTVTMAQLGTANTSGDARTFLRGDGVWAQSSPSTLTSVIAARVNPFLPVCNAVRRFNCRLSKGLGQ